MAYDSGKMRLMGGVPGQQLFLYRSEDSATQVAAPGYLDRAVEEYGLSGGDLVLAVTGVPGSLAVGLFAAEVAGPSASLVPAA